jgi:hypothetical protein
MTMEASSKGKGKILRVKTGYNPNSSSVGSQIPAFLFLAAGSGVLTIIAAQMLNVIDIYIKKKKNFVKDEKHQ